MLYSSFNRTYNSLAESFDFSRVIELKSSEEIPAASIRSTWPMTSVAFVALFFKHFLAKECSSSSLRACKSSYGKV